MTSTEYSASEHRASGYDGPVSAEVRESMRAADFYLRQDRGTVPEVLFEQSTTDLGDEPVAKGPFLDRAFHELEKQKLWKRVWQMACRENDIPNVGDRVVYDIVDQSIIIVRSAPDEIKAFHNTCMDRGTRLVDPEVGDPLSGKQFTCSFHKWSYHLDGSIKQIPCRWDFPKVRDADVHLSEVRTATWNGFVFINLDPDCQPFEEFRTSPCRGGRGLPGAGQADTGHQPAHDRQGQQDHVPRRRQSPDHYGWQPAYVSRSHGAAQSGRSAQGPGPSTPPPALP